MDVLKSLVIFGPDAGRLVDLDRQFGAFGFAIQVKTSAAVWVSVFWSVCPDEAARAMETHTGRPNFRLVAMHRETLNPRGFSAQVQRLRELEAVAL